MDKKIEHIRKKFLKTFKKENKEQIRKNSSHKWKKIKTKFRSFWKNKIMSNKNLSNKDLDDIIRILDNKGSGKKKGEIAIATIGIRQGPWRKVFKDIKKNKELKTNFNHLFNSKKDADQIKLLNDIEKICKKNNIKTLTADSANIINCFLFANEPENNLSMVSLKDRYQLIQFFELGDIHDIMALTYGERIIKTRKLIKPLQKKFRQKSTRLLCNFLYFKPVKAEWKKVTIIQKRLEIGEPINFKGLIYSPVNHEGTLALFCIMAKDLGFGIEKIRKDYPDIEAIYNGKRVKIEIEYLNSEFNHANPKECDIIVCWEKNTNLCPVKKVIELKEELKKLK